MKMSVWELKKTDIEEEDMNLMNVIIWDSVLNHNVCNNSPIVTINFLHIRENSMSSSVSKEEKLTTFKAIKQWNGKF